MSYGRVDVNLLPPELQPGPAVRYAVMLNVLIIAGTLAFIGLDSLYGLTQLSLARQERATLTDGIKASKTVLSDYDQLVNIRTKVQRYGLLVGLASGDYVDMPVLMDRVSRILPEGVYADRIGNQGSRGSTTTILVSLHASRRDPQLVIDTLRAFKRDPLFADSSMPDMNYEEADIDQLLKAIDVNWTVTGLADETGPKTPQFSFTINANVPRMLENVGLPKSFDESALFADFLKNLPPPVPQPPKPGQGGKPPAPPPAGAAGSQAPPSTAPAGVGVAEVH